MTRERRPLDPNVELEREAMNDGLLEMVACAIVFWVLALTGLESGNAVVSTMTLVLALPALVLIVFGFRYARRHFTYRRVPKPEMTNALSARIIAPALAGLLLFALMFAVVPVLGISASTLSSPATGVLIYGVISVAVFGTAAILFRRPRLWIYAVAFGIALPLLGPLYPGLADALILFGLPLVTGVVLMVRFARLHPAPPRESAPSGMAHA